MPLLTELQYADGKREGPYRLYVFRRDGYHLGGIWFNHTIRYPDEEISVDAAKAITDNAITMRLEVRICDGGDRLIFHSVAGAQLHPPPEVDFWSQIAQAE